MALRSRSSSTGSWAQKSRTSSPWIAGQLAQPLLVADPGGVVVGDDPLEDPQRRRAVGRIGHLAAVEVGVAAVQQPAVPVADRDRAVAAGVAGQRDQQDLGVDSGSTRMLSKPNHESPPAPWMRQRGLWSKWQAG